MERVLAGVQQFLPQTQVPLVATQVRLEDLPPDGALACDPPPPALVADIVALGVLQPVILMDGVERGYTVCDGRSRVRAARIAGLVTVPAVVAPLGHIAPSAIGAKANALRRDNPRTRLAFIEEALAAGLDERTICRVGGFTQAELRAACRLSSLIPPLRAALETGAIRASVARAAATLTTTQQATLVVRLRESGTLHTADVRAARTVARAESVAALPLALFETPSAGDRGPWPGDVQRLLEDARALVPPSANALRVAIDTALTLLKDCGEESPA